MTKYFHIVYPTTRDVSEREMLQRGLDYHADGEIEKPEDPEHAALLLHEAGLITLTN